jgi:hypothetical protein
MRQVKLPALPGKREEGSIVVIAEQVALTQGVGQARHLRSLGIAPFVGDERFVTDAAEGDDLVVPDEEQVLWLG